MFKKIVAIAALVLSFNTNAVQCTKLGEDQLEVLKFSYDFGQDVDLGWTLASIALVESSAGRYLANWSTDDFGVYQNNIHTAMSRMKIDRNDHLGRAQLTTDLIRDRILSASLSLTELEYWMKVRKGNWRHAVQSYNAGWRYNSSRGVEYGQKVADALNMLRQCYPEIAR